ncbi:MAG TPA: TetR/AcrR family transcriptional regulator [Solimonas sp.]|nr:TetR/AcrR family transcriptional regulator [Solimonas sp.]
MLQPVDSKLARRLAVRSRRDTREEILNCAEELLQRRGFNGFAYQHIAVQLGIRNAAIHYHFPAKEDLGIALVQRYRDRFRAWSLALQPQDPWSQLRAYFATYTDHLEAEECRLCPGGALAAEFGTLPEPMRLEARLLMREIYEWLIAVLERGRREGALQFNGGAEDKAVEIGAALQGGLQIARLAGADRFHQLLDQLALELRGTREGVAASLP